jgi:DNA mismatch repair protein MutL
MAFPHEEKPPGPGGAAGPRIRVLHEEVVARIAAGEMIERPASVVKELVENSIDAGSTQITVIVRGAVDREVRVLDNGAGMSPADAALCVTRHATSKIEAASDLFDVTTLGFRGEALTSISDVSRFVLTTRRREDDEGTRVEVRGGERVGFEAAARAPGTTVEVRDLFHNVPVRRKFLRSPATEIRHVTRLLSSYAIAYPQIHFVLDVDGREVLGLPPVESLRERLVAIYGLGTVDRMVALQFEDRAALVRGMVGVPEIARGTREGQAFFVNRRWVASLSLGQALRAGFGDLIPHDRHPFGVVLLSVRPGSVDVNVHPTKREVRFERDREVFDAVRRGVREALRAHVPAFQASDGAGDLPASVLSRRASLAAGEGTPLGDLFKDGTGWQESLEALLSGGPPGAGEAAGPEGLFTLWQLHRRYILAQTRGGLVIVDQHAAHERILYEEALVRIRGADAAGQQLLFPQVLELTAEEFDAFTELEDRLSRLGFDVHAFGRNTVLVQGIPSGVRDWKEGQLFRDLLEEYAGESDPLASDEERLARSYACHAAVRAGDPLSQEEMNRLIDRLFATSTPHGDVHGRATYVRLSLEELDRRFGRG